MIVHLLRLSCRASGTQGPPVLLLYLGPFFACFPPASVDSLHEFPVVCYTHDLGMFVTTNTDILVPHVWVACHRGNRRGIPCFHLEEWGLYIFKTSKPTRNSSPLKPSSLWGRDTLILPKRPSGHCDMVSGVLGHPGLLDYFRFVLST